MCRGQRSQGVLSGQWAQCGLGPGMKKRLTKPRTHIVCVPTRLPFVSLCLCFISLNSLSPASLYLRLLASSVDFTELVYNRITHTCTQLAVRLHCVLDVFCSLQFLSCCLLPFLFGFPSSLYSCLSLRLDTIHLLLSLVFSDLRVLRQSVYTCTNTHGYQI